MASGAKEWWQSLCKDKCAFRLAQVITALEVWVAAVTFLVMNGSNLQGILGISEVEAPRAVKNATACVQGGKRMSRWFTGSTALHLSLHVDDLHPP